MDTLYFAQNSQIVNYIVNIIQSKYRYYLEN
jgi:hypothetical protein